MIFRTLRRFRGTSAFESERGQAFIETALSLPILMALLVGAAEFGRLAYASIEVANAAKAGVQYGAQSINTAGDTAGIQTAASNEATNLNNVNTSSALVSTCSDASLYDKTTQCPGAFVINTLTVNTSVSFNPLIHIPGFPGSMTLRGNAVQQVGGE